jgi:hypothetical protein
VQLHDGRKRLFNKKAGPLLVKAFREACEESGLTPDDFQTVCFRHILWDPDEVLSEHSYGTALDLNVARNGRSLAVGKAELDKHPKFVEAMERNGFKWGGRWKGKSRDPMHFELEVLA